jgi:hypothetical protein
MNVRERAATLAIGSREVLSDNGGTREFVLQLPWLVGHMLKTALRMALASLLERNRS